MVSNMGESSESSVSRWSHHQSFPSSSTVSSEHLPLLVERCVVVARQAAGYGLTVTGGYPVYVDTVRAGGSAHQAGVREGDRIVKVNGMPINTNNLQEVLRMITGGNNVALTLQSASFFAFPQPGTVSRSGSVKESGAKSVPLQPQNGHGHRHTPPTQKMPTTREDEEEGEVQGELELAVGAGVDGKSASEGEEAWRQQCVAELTQMLTAEKLELERLRAFPADANDLEAAHRRISDLHLRLRKLDPVFDDNPSITNILPASKVEPVKSWVDSGGMHYVQARDAATLEDDEELVGVDEVELNLAEPMGPFSELSELRTRPAHLAVFLNFLISNSDPSSLLFFLVTDSYHHTSNVKEMRRYAYEIFSTFLIPNAPLQMPETGQSLIQSIDKVLRATASQVVPNDADQLKKLFIPAKRRAIDDINDALAEFRQKRALGLSGIGGELYHQLENIARADHATELRICEQVLFKMLETLMALSNVNSPSDLEGCEPRCLALIISVATVIKVVMNVGRPGYAPWEKLLEKCPTFLTPPKSTVSSSMLSRVMPKRTVQVKDHQFQLNPVNLTTHCYQCRGVVWGVNPQAYACQNCDVVVHKQCATQLADHCYAQQKSSKGGGSSSAADAASRQNGKLTRSGVTGSSTLSLNKASQQAAVPSSTSYQLHQHHHGSEVRKASKHSQGDSYSVGGSARSPEYLLHHPHPPPHHHNHHHELSPSARGYSPSRERLHGVSTSLTPPQPRSQFVVPPLSPRSRLEEEDASDALIDNVQSPVEEMRAPPTAPSIASTSKRGGAAPSTTATSSPSSTSMLPPPVFTNSTAASRKLERIPAPDLPPSAPPPPPPPPSQPPPAPGSSSSAPSGQPTKKGPRTTCIVVENVKSMSSDSGIGRDDATAIGADGRPVVRAHSMKGEAANQIKRAGRATNSLGAGDSRVSEESLPMAAVLSVEKATSETAIVSEAQPGVSSAGSAPRLSKAAEISSEEDEERNRMVQSVERVVIEDNDPDFEVETEVPQLESLVSGEVLKHLKPKEKKRQEVVNELFHTERTHLRNLKILHKVFYRPLVLQRQIPTSLVHLLFGNLDELLEVHSAMHGKMCEAVKKWRVAKNGGEMPAGLFGDIGQLVESIFDGPTGEKLKQATALFCMNQQHALDALRMRYSRSNKDDPLCAILVDAEQNVLCRKLQLKDMIPVEMQRLVKYPLLLETIAKYTPDPSDELASIQNAVIHAKRILSAVNAAKRNAENRHRLEELQTRLELEGGAGAVFFSKFDFRDHKLIHDGALVWRQSRGKSVDIHAVLLEHLIVFLAKSGDGSGNRLQLKIHEPGGIPLLRLAAVEVEEKASDKRAFSLFCRTDLRMFELIAPTVSERKTWYRLIENQVSVIGGNAAMAGGSSLAVPFSSSSSLVSSPQPPLHQHLVRATVVEGDEPPSTGRMEHVHVMTHPQLVNANEITVQQPKVLEPAQPILTPAEKLERNDKLIIDALAEKHQILADLIDELEKRGNKKELDRIAEQMTGLATTELKHRNAREVAMSAIVHGNRLLDAINKGMSGKRGEGDKLAVDDAERHLPSVACYKLTGIAAPLMNHVKALMQFVQLNEAEIGALRQEIAALKERTGGSQATLPNNNSTGSTAGVGGLANRAQPGNPESSGGGANLVLRSS